MRTFSDNLLDEKNIQLELNRAIDTFTSFIFNAGAGSGKTYSLIEALKHILKTRARELQERNQKVICITYTNVATNEIKKRLGSTNLIEVSTIHDMLWEQIKGYSTTELVAIHKLRLQSEFDKLTCKINDLVEGSPKLQSCLDDDIFQELLSEESRDKYYRILAEHPYAEPFTKAYLKEFGERHTYLDQALMNNFSKFKQFMGWNFSKSRLIKAIKKIESLECSEDKYRQTNKLRIQYDSKSNKDRLAAMKFSHDTLIDYSLELFKEFPILQKIFIDKYPYLFIDEYQDTSPKVIELIELLHKCYKEKQANKQFFWMVGFFGDHRQNIYSNDNDDEKSIGDKLYQKNKDSQTYKIISKKYNRRSSKAIIKVSNNIRADHDFNQVPINPNIGEGDVRFIRLVDISESQEPREYVADVVKAFKIAYKGTKEIHCLVALNKSIAELGGFSDIYDVASAVINYKELNTQLLSQQLSSLHPVLLFIYKLLNIYHKIEHNDGKTLLDFYGKLTESEGKKYTISQAISLYQALKLDLPKTTLGSFITHLEKRMVKETSGLEKQLIQSHFGEKYNERSEFFFNGLLLELMPEDKRTELEGFLNISLDGWKNWFNYINQTSQEIIYHTFHGTKGAEYENVIIFMGHNFGRRGRDKFKKYFLQVDSPDPDDMFLNTQNLMYVICSRAIKNLWVVYTDDLTEIKSSIEKLFGSIYEPID